jgi:aminoglycoside phosphotransferase (APT) family kinase protein
VTDDVGQALIAHLRERLGEPGLEFAEPLAPIGGGFDTRIFAFRLRGAPPAYAAPLILRLLGPQDVPARALREAVTQNTVAELGYPAPRALYATADVSPLGGGFLVMERLPGKPLMDAGPATMSRVLLEMQLRLHALDADALSQALKREDHASTAAGGPALGWETMTLDGHLAQLERRVSGGALDGLAASVAWLARHRPPEPARRAICHGDFHPGNILVSGATVTGVIDWPNALMADPAYDLAMTRTILGLVPLDLLGRSTPLRWLIAGLRPLMLRRYLADYRRRRPLESSVLAYYEALSCMRQLVRTAENRGRPGPLNPLDGSSFGEALAARFARISGIMPRLPPAKADLRP